MVSGSCFVVMQHSVQLALSSLTYPVHAIVRRAIALDESVSTVVQRVFREGQVRA